MESARILIVDDEPKHVRLVREILAAVGYTVLTSSSGDKAITTLILEEPDLVILDILLLGALDGYQLAERIRELTDVPIIILSARNRQADILRGFEVGADDFLTKPFSAQELLARINAILSRTMQKKINSDQSMITCGDLKMDLLSRRVSINEHEVYLTPKEFKLLKTLARHPNRVLLHENLLEEVWGVDYREDQEYLRTYIHYLRRKLEPDPTNPQLIIRVPGVGYQLKIKDADSSF